jgi:hypothetical protein
MSGGGEEQRETIRPEFDRSIMIDFQGAKITSDTGFLLLRAIVWLQPSPCPDTTDLFSREGDKHILID